jgi:hypothetical protein
MRSKYHRLEQNLEEAIRTGNFSLQAEIREEIRQLPQKSRILDTNLGKNEQSDKEISKLKNDLAISKNDLAKKKKDIDELIRVCSDVGKLVDQHKLMELRTEIERCQNELELCKREKKR